MLLFDDDLLVVVSPDPRTSQQYVDSLGSVTGDVFSTRPMHGTVALATDVSPGGPASLSWVENGRLVQVIGHDGSDLDHLTLTAQGLAIT
jgi:hypothetical protein